jgi:5'-nucleotidase
MIRLVRSLLIVFVAGLIGAAPAPTQLTVKLIAINDLHGYLEPTETFAPYPADPQHPIHVPVGGVAYLASEIAKLRAENPQNALVGAGDMVGASPLTSALFHDEPTIQALSAMGMDVTSVGNHEFDGGKAELLRKQHGGCRPGGTIGVDTCVIDGAFHGATFQYLAANVIDTATNTTLFPPYAIKYFSTPDGKRVGIAFVGVVLRDTPTIVDPSGVRGLRFTDEATTINALLPEIAARGVHAVVVLIHQGIFTKVSYDDLSCGGAKGDLLDVLNRLDPSIRLVVSGHTHWPYLCPNGQGTTNPHVFYSSAGRFGQIVSDLDVTLDVASDTIVGVHGENDLVVNDHAPNPLASTVPALAPDPAVASLVATYHAKSAALVNRVIGHITGDLLQSSPNRGDTGESAIGDVIADSRVAETHAPPAAATLAFINGGGIRTSLHYHPLDATTPPGVVTFGEAYNVLPFGTFLVTETLTGAQIEQLLDEQWIGKQGDIELLGVSSRLHYTWDASKPDGASKVVPGSVMVDGHPIDPNAPYRVTVDQFMLGGGDGYVVLGRGTNRVAGPVDLQALTDYISANSPLAPPPANRITRLH